mgnify:CR=1 FL=1
MWLLWTLVGLILGLPIIVYGISAFQGISIGAAVMTNMELTGWIYILLISGLVFLIISGLTVNFLFVTLRNIRGP